MSLKRKLSEKVTHLLGVPNSAVSQVPTSLEETKKNLIRPTRTFEAFFEHLKDKNFIPDVCVDVGAAEGTESIYTAFPEATHYVFEPLPDFHSTLAENLSTYNAVIRDCILSDEVGQRTLLRHADLFGSSIMHQRADDDERVVSVRSSTLDIELSELDLHEKSVLLKTDCQGADLLVLKGAMQTLEHCEVVIVEASLFRFWGEHQADFYDIVDFMKKAGFALYDILDGLYRPLDSALGQVDLAFAKERGVLRAQPYW